MATKQVKVAFGSVCTQMKKFIENNDNTMGMIYEPSLETHSVSVRRAKRPRWCKTQLSPSSAPHSPETQTEVLKIVSEELLHNGESNSDDNKEDSKKRNEPSSSSMGGDCSIGEDLRGSILGATVRQSKHNKKQTTER